MARAFTNQQRELMRSPDLASNILATFYLDEGTYRFCDYDYDLFDGTNTYVGASALCDTSEIRSAAGMAAEAVTLTIDGNRMEQYGIQDPASVMREIMNYMHLQRRVDISQGFRYTYNKDLNLVVPLFAGKISSAKWVDPEIEMPGEGDPGLATLTILLDSLAMRYNRKSGRTRSHNDQLEIDPTDNFYSLTQNAIQNERILYWGKKTPAGVNVTYGAQVGASPGQIRQDFYDRWS